MKILTVTDKMDIGGAETHIFTLLCELKARGYDITLLSAGGVYENQLSDIGIRCVRAPLDKRDPISIIRSRNILKRECGICDIVHTHTRFSSFLVKTLRRGERRFPPSVVTAHLNFPLFPFGKLAFWGDRTLAVSEDIKGYLMENYGIPSDSITLTQNSIDTNLFSPTENRKKLIIHTSRIDKGRAKTALLLCDIAPRLLSEFPDWRILIVGDGNMYSALLEKEREVNKILGFEGVILAGARDDIPKILRCGSVFVGVSRAALEGMSSGLATVISGDEGYGGILTDDNFDLLYSTNFCARGLKSASADALLFDLREILSNDKKRAELSLLSRELIEKNYKCERMANDAEHTYLEVRKSPSVLLLGFFGYGNLGDETTLLQALRLLEDKNVTDISVLVSDKERAREEFGNLRAFDRMNPRDIARAVDRCDILVLCGGNLLQNETSLRSLIYYERIIRFAKGRGKRIYLISSGFGEIHGIFAKILLSSSLRSANFCGCRTEYDLKIAGKLCQEARLMPDLCFTLSEKSYQSAKKRFLWIVSSREEISIEEIKRIASMRNLTPVAALMFPGEEKTIIGKLRDEKIEFYTPRDFNAFSEVVSSAEFTVSERLHGAIFSLICHTPSYLTAYACKNKALIDEIEKLSYNDKLLLPYDYDSVCEKKEIGVQDSDFNYVIQFLKEKIYSCMSDLF